MKRFVKMNRVRAVSVVTFTLLSLVLAFAPSAARARLLRGPAVIDLSDGIDEGAEEALSVALKSEPLISVGYKALSRDILPPPLLDVVAGEVKAGNRVLIVGHSDTVGPKLLNKSLGLQYAVDTAHRLMRVLELDAWKFYCASIGEDEASDEAGISVYRYEGPMPPPPPEPKPVTILSPPPDGTMTHNFWAIWDSDAESVIWGRQFGGEIDLWTVNTNLSDFRLPYPALSQGSAVGAQFQDGKGMTEGRWQEPIEDPRLTLCVESMESGWSLISGAALPDGGEVIVWAGGIPYPTTVENGKYEIAVARYLPQMKAYAQTYDAKGRAVVGPVLELPPSLQGSPKMLAVLTWDGDGVDLDMHGWRRGRQTRPQDPDPSMSATAAPGVRLLFDGDRRRRASAMWIDETDDLELEVRLFSDLGNGADAMLFIVTDPGDPILRRGEIIGPRRMSGTVMWQRWLALNLRDGK